MAIKVTIDWKGKKGFENLIRYIDNNMVYGEAQEQIRVIGHHCADNMRSTIKESKKRPSLGSNLEDNITAETLNTTAGVEVGIGRISKLKTNAPYYEVLDAGGYVPYSTVKGAPLGSFYGNPPTAGGNGDNWERSGNKGFFMKPKKPIEGIDYIGKAIRNLDIELRNVMEKLGAKFIDGAKQASGSTFVKAWGKRVRFYKKGGVDMG
jgi:hypothetical protein